MHSCYLVVVHLAELCDYSHVLHSRAIDMAGMLHLQLTASMRAVQVVCQA